MLAFRLMREAWAVESVGLSFTTLPKNEKLLFMFNNDHADHDFAFGKDKSDLPTMSR